MQPLAIDLFCGLGGWTEGLLSEGYRVIGFDNERHIYGDHAYPAQLVIQDVLTLHGRQLKDAALIVASPPCQGYSYRAMPWKRAKALPPPDNSLFEACFRIQREASEAKGEYIPLVVENVRGAQKWVGRSRYHFGSFHLWGDVPALMPSTNRLKLKQWSDAPENNPLCDCGHRENDHGFNPDQPCGLCSCINPVWEREGVKVASVSGRRTDVGNGARFTTRDCGIEGMKGAGDGWFNDAKRKGGTETGRLSQSGSKSPVRKAASAMIAKIPLVLSRHIGKSWHP